MRRSVASIVVLVALSSSVAHSVTTPSRSEAAGPNPVLIVAGTLSPEFALDPLKLRLQADGFNVYTMALPDAGLGDIAVASQAVAAKVDQIRSATGAAKVDLIGHSQGGLENRYFMKFLGGASKVGTYVSLGTPQYGASAANLIAFLALGNCLGITGCQQMAIGSSFLANLNAGDDTPGSARYVSIYTLYDELVQPFTNAKIYDGATNVLVQSKCPLRTVGHLGLILDGAVYGLVEASLRGGSITTNCFAL